MAVQDLTLSFVREDFTPLIFHAISLIFQFYHLDHPYPLN